MSFMLLLRLILLLAGFVVDKKPDQTLTAAPGVYDVTWSRTTTTDWSSIKAIDNFIAPWSQHNDRTEFKAFYTDQYFVFRFKVEDAAIVDTGDTEQSVASGDRVELFFSPSPLLTDPYYCIEISPSGRVLDYKAKYHRQFDNSWAMQGLQVSTKRSTKGYDVEGRMELTFFRKLMNTNKMKGTKVYVGAFRADISPEQMPDGFVWYSWLRPDAASPDFHIPSSFGVFQF